MSRSPQSPDRRSHHESIEELRRHLREADEDRFRLTRQALSQILQPTNLLDRRQPRVSVQEIRRDLREADEDRFRLMLLAKARSRSSRLFGVGLLLLIGTAFIVRTAQAPTRAQATARPGPGVKQNAGAAPFMAVERQRELTIVRPPAERTSVLRPATNVRESAAFQPRRRAMAPTRVDRSSRPPKDTPSREVPRPLHPGEFGRERQSR
jgi:hypothetical protein